MINNDITRFFGIIIVGPFRNQVVFTLIKGGTMGDFHEKDKIKCLLWCNRHCCPCGKACGTDILQLLWPMVVTGFTISVLTFLFSEFIVPYASARSNEIWKVQVEKQDMTKFYGSKQIWYKSENSIYWIRHFRGGKAIMEDPSFFFFGESR